MRILASPGLVRVHFNCCRGQVVPCSMKSQVFTAVYFSGHCLKLPQFLEMTWVSFPRFFHIAGQFRICFLQILLFAMFWQCPRCPVHGWSVPLFASKFGPIILLLPLDLEKSLSYHAGPSLPRPHRPSIGRPAIQQIGAGAVVDRRKNEQISKTVADA